MGLLPYAARDVLRNRRRSVSSILGVLLAVTFVAGTFIAIDSSARATLDASLAGIPGDFSFSIYTFGPNQVNYSTLEQAILELGGVVNVSVYRNLGSLAFELRNASGRVVGSYGVSQALAINPDRPPILIQDSKVSGSLTLPRGSVGLSRDVARTLAVGLGDSVRAVYALSDMTLGTNLTVRAIIEPTLPTGFNGSPPPYYFYGGSIAVVDIRDADWLLAQLNQSSTSGKTFNGEVWIDRTAYVNPYDTVLTTRNLERMQRRLQAVLGSQGSSISDNILSRIQDFSNRIAAQRIQFFIFSAPVVLLGVYLGAVGVDLGHAERRRELAILKTRGARRGQLLGLLLTEAVFGGLIAAVIGLAAGVLVSRLLIGIVNPTPGSSPLYDSFSLSADTVLAVALESILLMAAVAYRSAKRTAGLPIIETLRYYAPGETKIHYSPRVDVILVSAGLLDYVLVWWRGGSSTNVLTFLVGVIPFLLLPFVPLMLIVGLTRLLTRGTGKVYDWFSHAAKPLVGELYHIIRRNLTRNPRRSSNVAIIIALGIAFGTFTLSTLATQDAHTVREIRAQVGADMAVQPIDSQKNLEPNLTAVPGVAGAVLVRSFSSQSSNYCCPTVFGFDPKSFFAVAQPESWYFLDGNSESARNVLSTTGQVLISQAFFNQAFLEVGDPIYLSETFMTSNNTQQVVQVNVTVGGVVRSLPGTGFGSSSAIFGSFDTLAPLQGGPPYSHSDVYLVDLAPSASWRSVKTAITSDRNVAYVTVADEQIEALTSNPFARALYQFISMELLFIGIILTVGIGLILYAASLERDVEFAAIIARGSSGWQTAKLLVGEAFVIMLVGLAIGASVGIGTAFFATQFIAAGPPGSLAPLVPYFFVFPLEALLLVLLGPAAMLLSAVLVSLRTARMNVAQVLKLRGG